VEEIAAEENQQQEIVEHEQERDPADNHVRISIVKLDPVAPATRASARRGWGSVGVFL
jgi:hypothetical protein